MQMGPVLCATKSILWKTSPLSEVAGQQFSRQFNYFKIVLDMGPILCYYHFMNKGSLCEWCHLPISTAKYKNARHCSEACHHQHKKQLQRKRKILAAKEVRRCERCHGRIPFTLSLRAKYCSKRCQIEINLFNRLIFQPCECQRCGDLFESLVPAVAKYCPFCRRLDNDHYRRCLKYGLPYDWRVKTDIVLEEEGYICHVCKQLAPKELRGTFEPSAPELDHIIELSNPNSLGHVRANVACIHRKCNYQKYLATKI